MSSTITNGCLCDFFQNWMDFWLDVATWKGIDEQKIVSILNWKVGQVVQGMNFIANYHVIAAYLRKLQCNSIGFLAHIVMPTTLPKPPLFWSREFLRAWNLKCTNLTHIKTLKLCRTTPPFCLS
jgi:hypothetical protein